MNEMFQIGFDNDDLFFCHLGDIADTKPDYYINLQNCIFDNKAKYVQKYYTFDEETHEYYRKGAQFPLPKEYRDIQFPFFPVVGNHDLTHNGWALWSNIFGSSFYTFDVYVGDDGNGKSIYDHFIFLDTASGTLGKLQVDLHNVKLSPLPYSPFSYTPLYAPGARNYFPVNQPPGVYVKAVATAFSPKRKELFIVPVRRNHRGIGLCRVKVNAKRSPWNCSFHPRHVKRKDARIKRILYDAQNRIKNV